MIQENFCNKGFSELLFAFFFIITFHAILQILVGTPVFTYLLYTRISCKFYRLNEKGLKVHTIHLRFSSYGNVS